MTLVLRDYEARTREAVAYYWATLESQAVRQQTRRRRGVDRGNRAAVTGGKQMDGFAALVAALLTEHGLTGASIFRDRKLELPGYFRPTKRWDMVVVHEGQLLAAMEFKSHRGPSFGNNTNNRAEEALGTAHDLWRAFREGAFGNRAVRPWLGWIMLLESCEDSLAPVRQKEPHFEVFPEFKNCSYARRYELLLRRLYLEKLFDASALILSRVEDRETGVYQEPAEDLSMQRFLRALAGHVLTYVSVK